MWAKDHELVGRTVQIYTGHGDSEAATVLAVRVDRDLIRVRAHDDDEILVGNQWEE